MSELTKTLVYVGLAAVCIIASVVVVRSHSVDFSDEAINDQGELFFPRFTDPLEAARLEIVKWDEATGERREFEIRKDADGKWTIPSRYDYPTDLTNQLAEAATSIVGLVKEQVQPSGFADRALYKVLDPREAKPGDTGVGMFVRMSDQSNNTLAEFIIGETFPEAPEMRYVVVPGVDRVYVSRVDVSKLSTNFKDWINKDLLKLDTAAIHHIKLLDYSLDVEQRRFVGGDIIHLTYQPTAEEGQKWKLKDLPSGKQLDHAKLDDMLKAFDSLEIVDVRPKPESLGRFLGGQEGLQVSQQLAEGLAARGYYLMPLGNGAVDLRSKQGEILIAMNNGVEYQLRFGEKEQDLGSDTSDSEGDPVADSRYLLIAARFNEDLLPKPEYVELPDEPAAPGEEGKADPDKPAYSIQALENIRDQGLKSAADFKAAREEAESTNARIRERYERRVEAGKKAAEELNERFSGWFYIINDELFDRIHLQRDDIVADASSQPGVAAENGEADGGEAGSGATNNNGAGTNGANRGEAGSGEPSSDAPAVQGEDASQSQPSAATPTDDEPAQP